MVVLQFAWGGGPNNVHLPHMHYENCFCYPGTHDNETSVGWFQGSANEEDKAYIKAYLGSEGKDIAWDFIRSGLESVARTTVIMMQVGYVCMCGDAALQGRCACRCSAWRSAALEACRVRSGCVGCMVRWHATGAQRCCVCLCGARQGVVCAQSRPEGSCWG